MGLLTRPKDPRVSNEPSRTPLRVSRPVPDVPEGPPTRLGSLDPWGGLVRVGGPSGRSETIGVPTGKSGTRRWTLGEVQDG